MKDTTSTDSAVVADLAARNILLAAAPPPIQRTVEGGAPFVVLVDSNGAQQVHPLQSHEPPRKKALANFTEMKSFIDYVREFADARSRLFCDVDKRSFTAILDYHEATANDAQGRRGEHRAHLALRFTSAIEAWLTLAKSPISQAALAEFLEDRFRDIIEPEGAAVLELAKTLEVKNNVAFKSTQRRSDGGYDLTYEEQVQTKAGQNGVMEVPSKFMLEVAVFQGGNPLKLPMRLRFALNGGSVFFRITFLNLDELIREEVDDIRLEIASATEREVWAGSATLG